MLGGAAILTPVVNWDLDCPDTLKCVSQIDYHDDIRGAGKKSHRNKTKDKNWLQISSKESYMKRDLFKTYGFFFVCFNSYKGRSKRPWLRMTVTVKRNDQIELELTFKSFIQVWTFRNSVIFFRVSRKKKKQDTFTSKNEKLQFHRNYEFAKTWNREKEGSSQRTQNFLNATESVCTIENKKVVENVIKCTWKMKN